MTDLLTDRDEGNGAGLGPRTDHGLFAERRNATAEEVADVLAVLFALPSIADRPDAPRTVAVVGARLVVPPSGPSPEPLARQHAP